MSYLIENVEYIVF